MRISAFIPALAAALSIFLPLPCEADIIEDAGAIFDNQAVEDAEGVRIVDGRIVLLGAVAEKSRKTPPPDPAGEHLLELTDGSQVHGKLRVFGKGEVLWQRGDVAAEPLTFSPPDVRKITFRRDLSVSSQKANATLKLTGSDWVTGELLGLQNGKFRLGVDGATSMEIDREKVEWLHISKSPSDAYEGPAGPMGLAGWDTGGAAGTGAWEYADGALIARAAMPVSRRLEVLGESVEIEFSAGDGGNAMRGVMFTIQPGPITRGYSKGSIHFRFQGNSINANSYDGSNMKGFNASVPEDKNPPKESRYRILLDRRTGALLVYLNGTKVADWAIPRPKEPAQGASLSWQPTYWSPNMTWTLSKVRVRPWDGKKEADASDEAGREMLTSVKRAADPANSKTERISGKLELFQGDTLRFAGRDFVMSDSLFVRLEHGVMADPPAGAVARVWLAQRGEFDVTALGFRDGELKVRTAFAGDVTLPLSAVRAIEFPHRLRASDKALAECGDTLIFRNGDELRGTLVSANHDAGVKWKPVRGAKSVGFDVAHLAGVLLSVREKEGTAGANAAVRFRNGDWLPGELTHLDMRKLLLTSAATGPLRLERSEVRAIYFGQGGEVPVWDGAAERQAWMKATNSENYGQRAVVKASPGKEDAEKHNPWRYLDGAFTLPRSTGRNGFVNGPNVGRTFENLPDKVEVSFDLSTPDGPAGYSVQLFVDSQRPGLMIQGSWDSAYVYDMAPRKQGGAFFNQPQQIDFGERIGDDGNRRSFRFLADRRTGRLTMIVNGIVVGGFGSKSGKESAKPGKGIAILPQPINGSVTISNVWVGPWSGEAPEIPKPAPEKNAQGRKNGKIYAPPSDPEPDKIQPSPSVEHRTDVLTLVNGDETTGTIEGVSASELQLQCDIGKLDIPLSRALVVEFAGAPVPPASGLRLHFAGKGTLTVDSFSIADGTVTCHSVAAGPLSFPARALSEIVFQPRNAAPPGPRSTGKSVQFESGMEAVGDIAGGAILIQRHGEARRRDAKGPGDGIIR